MVYDINRFMNVDAEPGVQDSTQAVPVLNRERLRYVTENFHALQGLGTLALGLGSL